MSTTAAVGLIAVFVVDLINLFYISRLGEKEIAAAVGFAGVVGFFHTSICIGVTIGITAVVSRAIGAGRRADARGIATSSLVLMVAITVCVGIVTLVVLHPMLRALGASGDTERYAARYLAITVMSMPLLGVGMACAALLRSVGDARRAMMVTLGAAVATAVLDPILIFGLDMGLDGAAAASVVSRCMLAAVGMRGVVVRHQLLARFNRARFGDDARLLVGVAGPGVLTNLATPVGAAFVTHSIAQFGASAVAGQAIIDRVTPVAFGLVYSLSGAVGPILAQNLGAREYGRVRVGLRDALMFMVFAVGAAWLVLALAQSLIVRAFSAEGDAAALIHAYCSWIAAGFFFIGALFVANAAFNNLGRPLLSTGFNWARATLGTIPFAWIGSHYGPAGVLVGQAAGAAIFGTLAMVVAFRLATRLGPVQDASPALDARPVPEAGNAAALATLMPPKADDA
ncbi:MATE family efflux transporter [Variovorax rhizosphaerae]|uniref:MATE family efflux transporter n=1 Tax=Variovorax rhizosphaerae TaxID=1836200 RepID=A0ABU8WJZ2_9BURK